MSASKPLGIRLAGWLAELIGPEALKAGCRAARRAAARRPGERRRLEGLLRRALGRPPRPDELEAAATESIDVSADLLATFCLMGRPSAVAGQRQRFDLPALAELERARAQGKGVILASLHYGNYLGALMALSARVPVTLIVLDGPGYRWTEESGLKTAGVGAAGLDVVRALAANEVVCVFCDVDYFPENRLEPFLGEPIRPPRGAARLSEATGAPVVPAFCVKQEERWRLEPQPLIPSGPAREVEKALLAAMERQVRAKPAHWVFDLDVWDVERTDRVNRQRLSRSAKP